MAKDEISKIGTVFISYAHERPDFREEVRNLVCWLRERGIVVVSDHDHANRAPDVGWIMWMQHSVQAAAVVLVVCSPKYKARFEKLEEFGVGLGATFEGAILTQELYNASMRNRKFFPILPIGGSFDHIPLMLQTFWNDDYFPSGNEKILRLIRNVPSPGPTTLNSQPVAASLPPGRLRGPDDNRLLPREGEVLGRESEIADVRSFLSALQDAQTVAMHVTGVGGTGKTEVCKAALRQWLQQRPSANAYYVAIPDDAEPETLCFHIGTALGLSDVTSMGELARGVQQGLYYLDNLEGLAEKANGRAVLREFAVIPGMRILASSRVSLDGVLGRSRFIEVLPEEAAVQLFVQSWTGHPPVADDAMLRLFVIKDLGRHALSIALVARLGEIYSLESLQKKWRTTGVQLAAGDEQATRLDSLTKSLQLTSEVLGQHPGCLNLWTLAALFPEGISEATMDALLQQGGLDEATLHRLCRHHVLTRSGATYTMLAPMARFALDEAQAERGGFSFTTTREAAYAHFIGLAEPAASIASTPEALAARAALLASFASLHRFVLEESRNQSPDTGKLAQLDKRLTDQYQFRVLLGKDMLEAIVPQLPGQALPLLTLGDLERRLGNLPVARGHLNQAIALYTQVQDDLGRANALRSLGDLEMRLGRVGVAREHFELAVVLYTNMQTDLGRANALRSLGDLEHEIGKLPTARGHFKLAIQLYTEVKDDLGRANALKSLGDLEHGLGKVEVARGHYELALELFTNEQADLGRGNALQSLGDLERRAGQVAQALLHYINAMVLFRKEQEPVGSACTSAAMVRCYAALGQDDEKRGAATEAMAFALASNAPPVCKYVLNALLESGADEETLAPLRAGLAAGEA